MQRFPQFAQQACVLDGDNGLGREVLHKVDLLVGERPHLLAIHGNRANEFALLEHWHRHKGPRAREFDERNYAGVLLNE
ncbi:MAG: hypothetical protein WAR02_12120 [Pseudolabrys sp.]